MKLSKLLATFIIAATILTACGANENAESTTAKDVAMQTETTVSSEEYSTGDTTASESTTEANSGDSNANDSTTEETNANAQKHEIPYIDSLPVKTLDGNDFDIKSLFGDKITVVNVWATWCHFCAKEMPLFEKLSKDDRFNLVMLNSGEDKSMVDTYMSEHNYTFTPFLDKDLVVMNKFGFRGYPATIFIGPKGEFLYAHNGYIEEEMFERIMAEADKFIKNNL